VGDPFGLSLVKAVATNFRLERLHLVDIASPLIMKIV
jgi:hypothetical protein